MPRYELAVRLPGTSKHKVLADLPTEGMTEAQIVEGMKIAIGHKHARSMRVRYELLLLRDGKVFVREGRVHRKPATCR